MEWCNKSHSLNSSQRIAYSSLPRNILIHLHCRPGSLHTIPNERRATVAAPVRRIMIHERSRGSHRAGVGNSKPFLGFQPLTTLVPFHFGNTTHCLLRIVVAPHLLLIQPQFRRSTRGNFRRGIGNLGRTANARRLRSRGNCWRRLQFRCGEDRFLPHGSDGPETD